MPTSQLSPLEVLPYWEKYTKQTWKEKKKTSSTNLDRRTTTKHNLGTHTLYPSVRSVLRSLCTWGAASIFLLVRRVQLLSRPNQHHDGMQIYFLGHDNRIYKTNIQSLLAAGAVWLNLGPPRQAKGRRPEGCHGGSRCSQLPRLPGEIVFIIMEPILDSNR